MAHTMNDVLRTITRDYLDAIDPDYPPDPETIESDLLDKIQIEFEAENAIRPKGMKWRAPNSLNFQQIADIIARLYNVCRVTTAGANPDPAYDLLAIYQESGVDEGIYVTSDEMFRTLARKYDYTLTKRDFEEFMLALRDLAPRRARCCDRDLIAVNNGIFNFETKQLMPFDPEYVFLSKSRVDYDPNAVNSVIHNDTDNTDWDVETWMSELTDDPEITDLLWEILGAIIRPHVSWGKSAWFYSNTGNNGKGTLCSVMRSLTGDGSYASIPLADMGKDFMLEPLIRSTAIIVDENDVGTFIDKAANLKAIITNDVVQINRKFKTPIPYKFYGFMVQCLNEMPRIKDKSDSFFRRQLFVPFTKCFTGAERKYIKQDYLKRKEVLEYILKRVLHMDYYELSTPEACKSALSEYREFNDPVLQFIDEILPECKWTLLPFAFLYDLYRAWFQKYIPSGSPQSRNTFIKDLIDGIKDDPKWECLDKSKQIKTANHFSVGEPLCLEYNLKDWMDPNYASSKDINKSCIPGKKAVSYRGLTRKPIQIPNTQPVSGDPGTDTGTDPDTD